MSSEWIAGFNAKATINAAAYAFATYRTRAVGMIHDVSNTEGLAGNTQIAEPQLGAISNVSDAPVFECKLPGLIRLEATIRKATFDLGNNPFALPTAIFPSKYVELVIFYALAGPNWASPSFLIGDCDSDGDVRGLQPVTFNGTSDGFFDMNF